MVDVTVEKCLSYINNRFKLVVLASQRAHDLNTGAESVLKCGDSKNTVIALHEIANNKLDNYVLFNLVVHRCKKSVEVITDVNQKGLSQFNSDISEIDNNYFTNNKSDSEEDDLNEDFSFEDNISIDNESDL